MRNNVSLLYFLLMLALLLTSCSNAHVETQKSAQNPILSDINTTEPTGTASSDSSDLYCIMLGDVSDSDHSVNLDILKKYRFEDTQRYEDYLPPAQASVVYDGRTFVGELSSSDPIKWDGYIPEYCYTNELVTFHYNAEGMLTCFTFHSSALDEEKEVADTHDEYLEVAKSFLANLVNINRYEVSVNEEIGADSNRVVVEFRKYIAGLPTFDTAKIIFKDGKLYGYYGNMLGSISSEANCTYNLDIAMKTVLVTLDQIYMAQRENELEIRFKAPTFNLTMLKEGKLALVCDISVECLYPAGEFFHLYGTAFQFIISETGIAI